MRVAATLSLAAAFEGGARTSAQLSRTTGASPLGLEKLLRYLGALGLAAAEGDGWRLTDLGRQLEDDDTAEWLDLRGAHALRELGGALSLLAAVRDGRGDHERWFGAEYTRALEAAPTRLRQALEFDAEDAAYYAAALAAASVFADLSSLVIHGRAAGALAEELVARHPQVQVTIVAAPSALEVDARLYAEHPHITREPGSMLVARAPRSDAVLLSSVLGMHPDADALHILRQSTASVRPGGRVLVFGRVLDTDRANEYDYEEDLIDFALTGGGARRRDEHLALFADAGLTVADESTIGWGDTLFVLTAAG